MFGEPFESVLICPQPGKGAWTFATIPPGHALPATQAWGRTPIRATVDGRSWDTSLWTGKDGECLLAVPKKIRRSKVVGDTVTVQLAPRA